MKTYKAIFFDLDGTLIFSEPDLWQLYAQFARECGLALSADAARRAERFAHYYYAGYNYKADFERLGTEGFRQHYLTRVLQVMQCDGDPATAPEPCRSGQALEQAARVILQRLHETPRQRYTPGGTRETLEQLRERGYTLGLVTNRRADEMQESYHPHDLDRYFSFTVTSTDAGSPKPHRAMFDLALERSNCYAFEAIHVGDNYYADVAGAHALGIEAILLDPKGLFPEAECRVVISLPQLLDYLPQR